MIQKLLLSSLLLLSLYQCTKEPEQTNFCSHLKVVDIKVTNADDETLTLKWTSTSIAQSYQVQVFDGSNLVFEEQTINPNIVVEGLRANTSYKVSVKSFCNQDLPSSDVKEITATTNGGCNASAPINFKSEFTSNRLFRAQWESTDPNLKYIVKLLDKNTKVDLIKPIETITNSVVFDIPSGLNGDLIVQPICKIGEFEVASKNFATQNVTTESIISSTPFDLQDIQINCNVFDSLNSIRPRMLNLPPFSVSYMINEIPINSKEVRYIYMDVGLSIINFPIVIHNDNGNLKVYYNLNNTDCKIKNISKIASYDKYDFVNNATEEVTLEATHTRLTVTGKRAFVRILSTNN